MNSTSRSNETDKEDESEDGPLRPEIVGNSDKPEVDRDDDVEDEDEGKKSPADNDFVVELEDNEPIDLAALRISMP